MKQFFISLLFLSMSGLLIAQKPTTESLVLSVNKMKDESQNLIAKSAEKYGNVRGLGESVIAAGVGAVVNVALTEFVKLFTLYGEQEKEWNTMIQKESSYNDEIVCPNDVNDFYSSVSQNGAMDPRNFAFDGVTIRDTVNGVEVLKIVCSVDVSDVKLQELWKYGTFCLKLDTFVFKPYSAHLPNLQANGIRNTVGSKRDNTFNFDERLFYDVAVKLNVTSSWINQAAMVMNDVKLGEFNLCLHLRKENLDSDSVFRYKKGVNDSVLALSGRSFIVPRSCIVSDKKESLWGTGAFKITAQINEASGFDFNKQTNKRAKKWLKDYYSIRNMQKSSSQRFVDYMYTLYKQYFGVIVKTTASSAATTGLQSGLNGSSSSGTTGGQSAAAAGGAQAGGVQQ